MRHDFVVRLRVPRPTARALLTAAILFAPVSLVCPSHQQTATLTMYVPNAATASTAYASLSTNLKSRFGVTAGSTVLLVPQNCTTPNPGVVYTNDAGVSQSCGVNLRPVFIKGYTTAGTTSGALKNLAVLDVGGDIYTDALCFWGGTCLNYWPLAFGPTATYGAACTGTAPNTNCTYTTGTPPSTMYMKWLVPGATTTYRMNITTGAAQSPYIYNHYLVTPSGNLNILPPTGGVFNGKDAHPYGQAGQPAKMQTGLPNGTCGGCLSDNTCGHDTINDALGYSAYAAATNYGPDAKGVTTTIQCKIDFPMGGLVGNMEASETDAVVCCKFVFTKPTTADTLTFQPSAKCDVDPGVCTRLGYPNITACRSAFPCHTGIVPLP